MAPTPRTVLSAQRVVRLRPAFESLLSQRADAERLQHDPLRIPSRYSDPADQEIAAVFAALLGYGRVTAFLPVIESIMAQADAVGGPRAFIDGFDPQDAVALRPMKYRWNNGIDFVLLAAGLRRIMAEHDRLGAVIEGAWRKSHRNIRPALSAMVATLRAAVLAAAPEHGVVVSGFSGLPRGTRTLLASPDSGSACKRWNMLLRWMIRTDSPDLGIWALPASALVLPLDTHTHKLSWLLGLTRRTDASWKTAEEITRNLARLDPTDPVKYDFALAHLGISGGCRKERIPSICDPCAMVSVCQVGAP
ncbi:MAG: hypothetical protein ACI8RZ_003923 [Myxococcota bacterium]|jgi:uncharacterized protein (TIGR02757 family)